MGFQEAKITDEERPKIIPIIRLPSTSIGVNTIKPPKPVTKAVCTDSPETKSRAIKPRIKGEYIDDLIATAAIPKPKTRDSDMMTVRCDFRESAAQTFQVERFSQSCQAAERPLSVSSIKLETADVACQTKKRRRARSSRSPVIPLSPAANGDVRSRHDQEEEERAVTPVELTHVAPIETRIDRLLENPSVAMHIGSRDYTFKPIGISPAMFHSPHKPSVYVESHSPQYKKKKSRSRKSSRSQSPSQKGRHRANATHAANGYYRLPFSEV